MDLEMDKKTHMERINRKDIFPPKQIPRRERKHYTDELYDLQDRNNGLKGREAFMTKRHAGVFPSRLPPINPNKKFLITPDDPNSPERANLNIQIKPQQKSQSTEILRRDKKLSPCVSYVPFESHNGVIRTQRVRERHPSNVVLGTALAGKLKSGTVHYTNILPPIGETYTVRAKEYYSSVLNSKTSSPTNVELLDSDSSPTLGSADDWLGDFFETMKGFFTRQDENLNLFLSSESAGRRNGICDELDCDGNQIGALEMYRSKIINEIMSLYF